MLHRHTGLEPPHRQIGGGDCPRHKCFRNTQKPFHEPTLSRRLNTEYRYSKFEPHRTLWDICLTLLALIQPHTHCHQHQPVFALQHQHGSNRCTSKTTRKQAGRRCFDGPLECHEVVLPDRSYLDAHSSRDDRKRVIGTCATGKDEVCKSRGERNGAFSAAWGTAGHGQAVKV